VGKRGWEGYVAFTFPRKGIVILECPIYGNATYIVARDVWRNAARGSKERALEEFKAKRVLHTPTNPNRWLKKVKRRLSGRP
jgi:hypothetical protein